MVLAQSGHAVGKFSNISVVAKDAALNEQGLRPTGVEAQPQARAAHCATITGSLLGAIGGCLVGIGILAVPIVPVLAVGTSETAVVVTLAGAGIGLASGGLISALAVSGTSEN